ncbi:hypothetical protein [Cryobacterium arcticum]|uniref:Uncharacterized protein n=1 Tax=Cryobacterium arcticum TaxID=670052 RepID=A0A318A5Z9_9MICO|nr:hypothetical protein [Cryobacterium arcticum]PXA72791.1 hypothetical protein CTB96_01430 [Cryobacterium arcticum]
MIITVEDRPNVLLELLWIREAFTLQPHGEDLPPSLSDTPEVVQNAASSADTRAEWACAWPRIWHAAVAHAGADTASQLFDEIRTTPIGSAERAELLHQINGPNWRDEFGDGAFHHDSYSTWSQLGMDALLAGLSTPLEDHPERRDLPTLISAWHAGLTKIVTIPCAGEFTRKVSENALLMTDATREDSDSYRRALSTFVS